MSFIFIIIKDTLLSFYYIITYIEQFLPTSYHRVTTIIFTLSSEVLMFKNYENSNNNNNNNNNNDDNNNNNNNNNNTKNDNIYC